MKTKFNFFVIMALAIGVYVSSCKKDDPTMVKPTLVSEFKDVHSSYAEFVWSIEFPGLFETGVELSLNENMSDSTLYQGMQSGSTFKVTIENLIPATKYYYRYVVWNPVMRDEQGISSFMTEAGIPQLTTDEPTNVTQNTATFGGVVYNDGGTAVTKCGICWGTEPEPTVDGDHADIDATMEHFSIDVTGLSVETKYYIRAYATNRMGTGYGNEVTFFTGDILLPQVVTKEVKDVEWISLVGVGEVMSDGGGEILLRGFCWSSENQSPNINDSYVADDSNGTGLFEVRIDGLSANTTYNCRAFAKNSAGYEYGEIKVITTKSYQLPTVEIALDSYNWESAKISANIVSDGGSIVTKRGVCWSTSPNPEYNGLHFSSGSGIGEFTVDLKGLNTETTYHVRAYAFNSVGTAYSDDLTFTTSAVPHTPMGAINGLFSVSETEKVWFSQGNLQYIGSASSPYWKFADHQWDVLGDGSQASAAPNVDRDLFGWATSGYHDPDDPYNVNYQPYSTNSSIVNANYNQYGYGPSINQNNPNIAGSHYDWGVHNKIANGGDQAGFWRTLTRDEWNYVFNTRNASTINGTQNSRYAKAKVNDILGVILFPDNYAHPSGVTVPFGINDKGDIGWNYNTYNSTDWSKMEERGCVFLPAAGIRYMTSVESVGSFGGYWSANGYSGYNHGAYHVKFGSNYLYVEFENRFYGQSVRLIRSVR